MSFVETIFQRLLEKSSRPVLTELHSPHPISISGKELGEKISRVRAFLRQKKIQKGNRVVLLGPNSIAWMACDLGILAEGAVCVPLYSRQNPKELAFMVEDSEPSLLISSEAMLSNQVFQHSSIPCPSTTFEEIFQTPPLSSPPVSLDPQDVVTMVYTSGTSGKPKGVMLNVSNIDYMLDQTARRLEETTGRKEANDIVFHFLPVCFAGSRMMLWTQLFRGNPVLLSTNLSKLADEIKTANPNYYLNVPAVLERTKTAVLENISKTKTFVQWMYRMGLRSYSNLRTQRGSWKDQLQYRWVQKILFSKIKQKIGSQLEFLICGSAPLHPDTQQWFEMIGIPVLQVYGLTETTAIITMDRLHQVKTGRVGSAIPGCEIKINEEGELLCRGPNVFPGYWNRPQETAEMLKDGWLYTGDQADRDSQGNLQIHGRMKDILVPESGHNVAPEPIENKLLEECPGLQHVVVIGHARPFLTVIVSGQVNDQKIEEAIERMNQTLPHYRKIRKFYHSPESFTVENGLLTINQKLRRKTIEKYFQKPLEQLYVQKDAHA